MAKFVKTCCVYILLPILISTVSFLFFQLPQYSGVHISPSRGYNPVTITRDQFGVPTIEAKTLQDTLYGLGYVHAQDRLWSIHFKKMIIAGRTAEMFGTEGLPVDRFFRNLSLRRYIENATNFLDEESLGQFQAYVDGVNDYVASLKVLPLEFWMTWTNVEEYTIVDAVASGKLLSFFLALDFQFEFIVETLEELLGPEKAKEIIPHDHDRFFWKETTILNDDELKQSNIYQKFDADYIITDSANLEQLPKERRPFEPVKCSGESEDCLGDLRKGPTWANQFIEDKGTAGKGSVGAKIAKEIKDMKQQADIGSNSWVVNGNYTTTGRPILANDPHLTNAMPSFWYNVALVFGENHTTGMTLPGMPGVVIGKTKDIAWGVTNLFADTSDVYTLKTKGGKLLL